MQTVLIVIHLLVVTALIVTVLLQRSEGGALGMGGGGGGGNGFFSGRGQANALTRATAILGTLFFITSISLTILAGWNRAPKSIFEGAAPVAPAGQTLPAEPAKDGLFDQLKKLQDERSSSGAPAAPKKPDLPVVSPPQSAPVDSSPDKAGDAKPADSPPKQ